MRHGGVDINRAHAFLDRTFHAHQADAALVLHQLTDGTDTTVTKVIDIVNFAAAVFQVNEDLEDSEDIFLAEDTDLVVCLEVEA